MHGLGQFRFYRDDVYAAFLPVAGDQSLYPLSLGQPARGASRRASLLGRFYQLVMAEQVQDLFPEVLDA